MEAPKSWTDLPDPKWRNLLAVGCLGLDGAIGVWAVQMHEMLGWSSQDPATLLNAGERSAGLAVPAATVLLSISRSNQLRLIYPEEGILAMIAPSAIVRNAPHSNAAKLFMEFQTKPQMTAVLPRFFAGPLRPNSPPEGATPPSLRFASPMW